MDVNHCLQLYAFCSVTVPHLWWLRHDRHVHNNNSFGDSIHSILAMCKAKPCNTVQITTGVSHQTNTHIWICHENHIMFETNVRESIDQEEMSELSIKVK